MHQWAVRSPRLRPLASASPSSIFMLATMGCIIPELVSVHGLAAPTFVNERGVQARLASGTWLPSRGWRCHELRATPPDGARARPHLHACHHGLHHPRARLCPRPHRSAPSRKSTVCRRRRTLGPGSLHGGWRCHKLRAPPPPERNEARPHLHAGHHGLHHPRVKLRPQPRRSAPSRTSAACKDRLASGT